MDLSKHLVLFTLNDRNFALPLDNVKRITRAAAVTPLPSGIDIVVGVINLQGQIMPVINIRKRFSMDEKTISADDHFIVAEVKNKTFAILVDTVTDIIEFSDTEFTKNEGELFNLPYVKGIVNKGQQMILIHDLETLLSNEEIEQISKVIVKSKNPSKTSKSRQPKTKK